MPFDFSPQTRDDAWLLEPWRQILRAAAAHIRAHGHTKGCMRDWRGRTCARGAIHTADSLRRYPDTPMPVPMSTLPEAVRADAELTVFVAGHGRFSGLTAWNDAPERTAEEVIAAMEACARSRPTTCG